MRFLALYVRSRKIPVALAVMVLASLGFWALDLADVRLLILTAGLGVGAAAGGLGGQDLDLDRTAALNWPVRRALHIIAIALVMSSLIIATDMGVTPVIVRDCAGLTGLAALGAVLFGRHLAWAPPLVMTVWSVILPVPSEIVSWLREPAASLPATLTAAVLAAAGLLAYPHFGPRTS
ncbi:hypothetical protein [Actinocrispum sp. NPDC049592]|uniref:hypothetical protein n=1 Tax=Actinocrispum sp. NPDC049592 TaxID=3154835 RepID=UPI003413E1D5